MAPLIPSTFNQNLAKLPTNLKRLTHIHITLYILALCSLLTACAGNTIYDHHLAIPNCIWGKENPLLYLVQIEDTTTQANTAITVRFTSRTSLKNLPLKLTCVTPDQQVINRTVNVVLKDRNGQARGESMANLWDLKTVVDPPLPFTTKGKYEISIQHLARPNRFSCITDVGLTIKQE